LRAQPHPQQLSTASDVAVLVEFEADVRPTLLTLARLERELSGVLGRKAGLRMSGI